MRAVPLWKELSAGLAGVVLMVGVAAADEAAVGIKVHKQSGINYITGGAAESAKAFEQVANRYPVQIHFTLGGEHVDTGPVRVTLRDIKGEAQVEADTEGPLFYVNPPSGRWTFEAERNGEKQVKTKDLTGRRYLIIDFDFAKP